MSLSHVVLQGSERTRMSGTRALGAEDEHQWLDVTVKLRRKAPLPEFQGRPQAKMSSDDLANYGASDDDIKKVTASFQKYGLKVLDTNPGTRTVRLGGSVSAMEQAFQVKLVKFAHERGDFRGRRGVIQIPKELAGIVIAVLGLDDRPVARERLRSMRRHSLNLATTQHRSWFFPGELAAPGIYDFPTGDGSGQCIGLIELGGGYFPDDLAAFCKAANVSVPEVISVSVNHAPTNQKDGNEGEVMLDVEVVAGACPKATVVVYFSDLTEQGWVDVLDAAIHDQQHKPSVISISWGDAEDNASWTSAGIQQVNETLKEAALLEITVCVASGDDGADDQVGDGHAHVDFPASSPYALSVGGTTLHIESGKRVETAWKTGDGLRKDNGGSSGGGRSVVFDSPTWQSSVTIPSTNPGAKSGRCVPDVSADADGNTGYFMVVDGQAGPNGGTSASAPLWASLVARINASLGKRIGYLTPLLFQAASGGGPSIGAQACNDITQGNNSTPGVTGYQAGNGYDLVTGWGTPIGSKLLTLLKALV
jgi:kumamolisin